MERRDSVDRALQSTGVEPPWANDVLGFESILVTQWWIFSLGTYWWGCDRGIIYCNCTVFSLETKPEALRHDFVALAAVT